MSKRSLTWLRQNTNVEDLLDDGIENNSDMASFAEIDGSDSSAAAISQQSEPSSQSPLSADRPDPVASAPISFIGALLGSVLIIGGALLVLLPIDTFVFHQQAGRLPSFWEHVTVGGSEFYGGAGLLLGLSLIACSIYKPRR